MIYVLIHDKGKVNYPQTFYEKNEALFKKRNSEGWGVYFAVNSFEATEEEMRKHKKQTKRNIPFLKKLNYVFADLDIAKKGDGQGREEKEQKKEMLALELFDILPPSKIIDTSNGIQPLWELVGCGVDEATQKRYVALINGIIAWSKTKGAAGDEVKDVTRVLRVPGYYHMKEEPYLCKLMAKESFKYTLEEMEKAFAEFIKKPEPPKAQKAMGKLDDLSQAIDRLDFKEVVKAAFASIGRNCEFDRQDRLVIDGRLTGNFKSSNGDFLASTSHEPFIGNRITAVADIKQISNKEARAWIIEAFNLRKTIQKEKAAEITKPKTRKKLEQYYSWGTRALTESFAPIKCTTYSIIGGGYGVGKTPFCTNMALANVELGHRVLYLSLEMDTEEIFDHQARKAAGINIAEEIYQKIPEQKQAVYASKIQELRSMSDFVLKGVRGGVDVDWEALVGLIDGEFDLIFIDNFNLIKKIDGLSQYEHEGELSKRFLGLAEDKQTPIIVVHHYSKGGAKETQKTGYSLAGNAKIQNDAQRIVLLDRKTTSFNRDVDEEEPTEKEKATLKVLLDKGRSYDRGILKIVYFDKGRFRDDFPEKQYESVDYWQNNI